jgi:lysophospholipase L1-like esterase
MNRPWTRYAWIGVGAALAAYAALHAWRIQRSMALAAEAHPVSAIPTHARESWLVVGDSTAVGVGAADPRSSLVGRIVAQNPDAAVVNLGRNGARFADVAEQLRRAQGHYDTVLVLAGGNETTSRHSPERIETELRELLRLARSKAPRVVFMPGGNLGNAALFEWPISTWLGHRSREVRQVEMRVAAEEGVLFVDLFREPEDDPFVQEPKRFLARDGLHPSDEGYALWHGQLMARLEAPAPRT